MMIFYTHYFVCLIFFYFSDLGQYACTTTVNSTPYVIWQTITIQPYPNIQVSSHKVVKCEDLVLTLQCCVKRPYEVKWTDTLACNSTSTGYTHGSMCINMYTSQICKHIFNLNLLF